MAKIVDDVLVRHSIFTTSLVKVSNCYCSVHLYRAKWSRYPGVSTENATVEFCTQKKVATLTGKTLCKYWPHFRIRNRLYFLTEFGNMAFAARSRRARADVDSALGGPASGVWHLLASCFRFPPRVHQTEAMVCILCRTTFNLLQRRWRKVFSDARANVQACATLVIFKCNISRLAYSLPTLCDLVLYVAVDIYIMS